MVAMRRFPGASELHANELSVLASVARPRRYPVGRALAIEGEPMNAISLLIRGAVEVRHPAGVVERADGHAAIGTLSTLARDARGLDCRATEDTLVLSVSLEDLEDVLEEVPSFLAHLLRYVVERGRVRPWLRPEATPRAGLSRTPPSERPFDLVERIFHLRTSPPFARASIDAVAALADVAREVRLVAGRSLFRRGEAANTAFLLVTGELDVESAGTRARYVPGDLVGDTEMFSTGAHEDEAKAAGPVVLLALDRGPLLDVCEDHVDLGIELLRWESAAVLAGRAGGAAAET